MATVVLLDIAADVLSRAGEFYTALFGWNFVNPPGYPDYSLIETSDAFGRPGIGGGL